MCNSTVTHTWPISDSYDTHIQSINNQSHNSSETHMKQCLTHMWLFYNPSLTQPMTHVRPIFDSHVINVRLTHEQSVTHPVTSASFSIPCSVYFCEAIATQFLQWCQKLKNYISLQFRWFVHKTRRKKIRKLTFKRTLIQFILFLQLYLQ